MCDRDADVVDAKVAMLCVTIGIWNVKGQPRRPRSLAFDLLGTGGAFTVVKDSSDVRGARGRTNATHCVFTFTALDSCVNVVSRKLEISGGALVGKVSST